MISAVPSISVVIPSYRREQVLLDTLAQLCELTQPADEILVVDQTECHQSRTAQKLQSLADDNIIKWHVLSKPSIPAAMNFGLLHAVSEVVLFLDDDIQLDPELVQAHRIEYTDESVHCVAGRVVQSWDQPLSKNDSSYILGREDDPDAFRFNSSKRAEIQRFMAGNVSFRRNSLLQVGGFDQNFVKVAYRFEAECANRFLSNGYTITFKPEAAINHLKVLQGGTRTFGHHLRTIMPGHSVGRYYYMLRVANQKNRWLKFLCAPFSCSITRFHLTRPWWIPVTFVAEISGMVWALCLYFQGPKLVEIKE